MGDKYIPGTGPLGAKLMVITDCPTIKETAAGRFLIDKEVESVLRDAGITSRNCWFTGVSKFHVPPNGKGKKIPFAVRAKTHGIDIGVQLKELQEEINSLKPHAILGFGSAPLWAMTGKKDLEFYRGSTLFGMGTKLIPTYNPAQLSFQSETAAEFKGYWNRILMVFDAKRASAQSQFPDYRPPQRQLEICRSSAHLLQFYNKYKHLLDVSVDIESGGSCVPVCLGLAFTKTHGMCIPLWNVDGMSTIPDNDMVQIWLIVADILMKHNIIGQNFNYDKDKIIRLGFKVRKVKDDVMMKGYAINPELPKSLGFNTSIFTEEPAYKNDEMYKGSYEDLFIGCARDCCVTLEVNENMNSDLDELNQRPFYENFLMQLPELYLDIQNQGFRVDPDERDRLLRKYIDWDERVRYELFKLVGTEINVNSPKQINLLLFENLKLPYRPGTGEEEITSLLNLQSLKNPVHRKILELILEGRRVRKSISTYLMAMPDFDGRMKTTYFPCLDTGRTSTGQMDPPIRPTIEVRDEEGKKKNKVLGIAFQTMTKHGDIGADIRGMYVPDTWHYEMIDGHLVQVFEEEVFIQADSAQAEARVIFLLADDEEALIDIDSRDYHAWTASWFFGGTELDYSKKVLGYEHPIRFVGKTLRHAGHLGAGKRRAAISVNTDARKFKIDIIITEAFAERGLKIFHSKQPKIQQVFQAQVVECLRRNRKLIAPLPYGVDAPIGGVRTFYERWGEDLNRAAFSYIPQRAVSDNTKAAALRIRKRIPYIKIVMESHDALLCSIPISKSKEWGAIIKQEMERPIDFSNCSLPRHELSIPCELEIGTNYRDFSKFKDIPQLTEGRWEPKLVPQSVTEKFTVVDLPKDTRRDENIYYHTVEKKRSFYVDE